MLLIFWIITLLMTVTIHEYAHGRVAYYFGDRTAKEAGRLTLNPLKHIDPFWTILFPIMLRMMGAPPVGMARPVPVNFLALRNPKRDMIWVALAGPAANLVFAGILSIIIHRIHYRFLLLPIYLNIGLAVFNLLPIPPLDGGRVLAGLLPSRLAYKMGKIEPYGFLIIFGLLWLGALHKIIIPIMNIVCFVLNVPGI